MKDIKGYEGLYAVTSCGRVWSYRRNKFLVHATIKSGYNYVNLYKDGKKKFCRVHRLVAEAYLPNPDNLPQVNHKNEVKTDNYVNNLEFCTASYNQHYGTCIERKSHRIRCIETGEVFDSLIDCERKTGCPVSNLSRHLRGSRSCVNGLHFERCV